MYSNEIKQYYQYLQYSDYYRVYGSSSFPFKVKVRLELGIGLTQVLVPYFYRKCKLHKDLIVYYRKKDNRICVFVEKIIHKLYFVRYVMIQKKYSCQIPETSDFGPGLRLYHTNGIVVGGGVKAGKCCALWQGVTIGNNIRKDHKGIATIGDYVNICAGAKVIGKIRIGNNVTIGANAVCVKDVNDNVIVGGVPSKIISVKSGDDHEGFNLDFLNYDEWRIKNGLT